MIGDYKAKKQVALTFILKAYLELLSLYILFTDDLQEH